jgi:hypothetical protein
MNLVQMQMDGRGEYNAKLLEQKNITDIQKGLALNDPTVQLHLWLNQ